MQNSRIETLRTLLWEVARVSLRSDSQLARKFVDNKLESHWNVHKIIYELCLTHYLYEYTPYRRLLEQELPKLKEMFMEDLPFNQLRNEHYVQEHVRCYCIPFLKFLAVFKSKKSIPTIWPWLDSDFVVNGELVDKLYKYFDNFDNTNKTIIAT